MNFEKAILAHSRWKAQLREFIAGNLTIDVNTVGKDDQCEFGKWLLTEGSHYASLPAYANLKAKHTMFHRAVAQVASQAKCLSKDAALELLDSPEGEYGRASAECINAIVHLKKSLA
jgi:hypothetical protein